MITLSTIVYGEYHGHELGFFRDIQLGHFNVSKKMIIVNNVDEDFEEEDGFEYVYVDTLRGQLLDTFGIEKGDAYNNYLMPQLAGVYACNTEYYMHLALDCCQCPTVYGSPLIYDDFFFDSFEELKKPNCTTTMIRWSHGNVGTAEEEQARTKLGWNFSSDKFYCRAGFTDQMFLGKAEKLRNVNYKYYKSAAEIIYAGPIYGEGSFEKRMVAHHVVDGCYNAVHKGESFYIHDPRSLK
jgi:hypothetical protein